MNDITKRAEDLSRELLHPAQRLVGLAEELRAMPLSTATAHLAAEYDETAKLYLSALKASELSREISHAHELHRFLTAARAKLETPAATLRSVCSSVITSWHRRQREEFERRRREQEQLERQRAERERAAQVAELKQAGEIEAAAQLAVEPLPVPVVTAKIAVMPPGVSAIKEWDAEVADLGAFLMSVAERSEFHYLVEVKQGALKRALTAAHGILPLAGLRVAQVERISHR